MSEKKEKKKKRILDLDRVFKPMNPQEGTKPKTRILDRGILDRLIEGKGPIRDFFKQNNKITGETLDSEQQKLAKSFREGIADAIGIPVGNINEASVVNWILDFTRSFIKPENLKDTITPSEHSLRMFGQEIGNIVRQAIEQLDKEPQLAADQEVPKVTEESSKPKEARKSLDISL